MPAIISETECWNYDSAPKGQLLAFISKLIDIILSFPGCFLFVVLVFNVSMLLYWNSILTINYFQRNTVTKEPWMSNTVEGKIRAHRNNLIIVGSQSNIFCGRNINEENAFSYNKHSWTSPSDKKLFAITGLHYRFFYNAHFYIFLCNKESSWVNLGIISPDH
jgi:hypothetical protein